MDIRAEDVMIRPAAPETADIAWQLIYSTDPHLFDCYFNNDRELTKASLIDWWQKDAGWFSHSGCHAAVFNEVAVGVEISFSRDRIIENARPTFANAHNTMEPDAFRHFSGIFRNYVQYLFPAIPKDTYYVQSLAISQGALGKGVGNKLLGRVFERAAADGFRCCQLDVAASNPAVNFYRRMGMELLSESRVPYLEEVYGVSKHYRMRKEL